MDIGCNASLGIRLKNTNVLSILQVTEELEKHYSALILTSGDSHSAESEPLFSHFQRLKLLKWSEFHP
jgi:uncharacterized radical SAM superfamily protein